MPSFTRDDVTIEYQLTGEAGQPPVLLIAPGGMNSTMARWATAPWNPIEGLDGFLRIAMDQRHAGASTAPVRPGDGWASYTADQVALLDHLELDHVQVVGMCIGGPYALGLIRAAPHRIRSAVLMQPIGLQNPVGPDNATGIQSAVGLEGNRHLFVDLFDQFAAAKTEQHPEANTDIWLAFREAMFGGDFLFNASREEVANCQTPLLVLMGDDPYHPSSISREIVKLAPNATLVERWREGPDRDAAVRTVRAFLTAHA